MQKPENFILVIFGASGDLARRKLIPALFDLYKQQMLPKHFKILGTGRTMMQDTEFREKMEGELLNKFSVKTNSPQIKGEITDFCKSLVYMAVNPDIKEDYSHLKEQLELLSGEIACKANYLYYFAIPPFMYGGVAERLSDAGLICEKGGWKRVIIEKPFGRDLASATELNNNLLKYLSEEQIYRIDHYLGKETVQNILVTRFSNSIFEPLWNRNYIDYVEITSAEALGVGSRAGYYDTAGALRDMLQNHLLQLLGIVAMEPPMSADATLIRNEMVKVFQSLRKMKPEQVQDYVVRGQYTPSEIKGQHVKGYREEPGISPKSKTETYVAMKCYIDNWRWSGVPFYIRTGKCMPTRVTEIVIHFKPTPHKIFEQENSEPIVGNELVIRIQPDEGLQLKIGMKKPGAGFKVDRINLDFRYASLNHSHIPEAYERLLCDCMMGDATLYQRNDAVKCTWEFVQPVLDAWQQESIPVYGYPAGSWGPEEADRLTRKEGHTWRYPCKNLVDSDIYCEL